MKSIDNKKLRSINRRAILARLRESGPAGAAELAAATGLSVATCAGIAAELVADSLALELGGRESTGGRPGRRYAHNPSRLFVAGIAIDAPPRRGGGAMILFSVANAEGAVVEEGGLRCARAVPETVDGMLEDLRARFPALRACSVSAPGVVRDGVVGLCDVPELSGLALERRIVQRHGLETVVDNDVNFAALGYGRGFDGRAAVGNLAFITFLKTSWPGAGLLVNGALLRGKSNFSGEVSFLPVPGNTRMEAERGGRMTAFPHADPARAVKYIARVIASVAAVLNPEVVVLSGDTLREEMLPGIRRHCSLLTPAEHLPDLELCTEFDRCRFAGMAGAALHIAERNDP